MAYTPREIKDRVAVGDDIFIVEDLGDNRIRLTPAPTHVSEAGTPVNKALLQPIENELGNLSSTKVDKVTGKGLSTNDFTTAEKTKLAGIAAGAQVNQTIHMEAGTVDHLGTIPLPSGFTRAQCKYFVMPNGEIQAGDGVGLNILHISVNQITGFVYAKAFGPGPNDQRDLTLSYITIAIKD